MKYKTTKMKQAALLKDRIKFPNPWFKPEQLKELEQSRVLTFFEYRRANSYAMREAAKKLGGEAMIVLGQLWPMIVNSEKHDTIDHYVDTFKTHCNTVYGKERVDDAFNYSGALQILGFDK